MYQKREKSCFIIALLYYAAYMLGLLLMGVLVSRQVKGYNIIEYLLFGAGVAIVLKRDRSFRPLGLGGEKWKANLIISAVIVATAFLTGWVLFDSPLPHLLKALFYYLFFISFIEEVVFRGMLQNYLFGLNANKYLIYCLGALLFSLSHLPFQMYLHGDVSFGYVVNALPQLVFTFFFHLLMCFITKKRGDILIPTALHFANNFLFC